jgi:hypothetical protein
MFNIASTVKCILIASVSLLAGSFLLPAQSSTTTTTVTGPNGKTATYQNNATWSKGNYTDNRSVTGFNGKTATYQSNASWGNGAYNGNRSYTGPNGKTASENVSRINGQLTKTVTGPNSHSRTYSHPVRHRRFR